MGWFLSMSFFLYIVYELLVGLAAATKSEENPVIASKIGTAQVMTCISWCTYPIVYLFPIGLLRVRHHFQVRSWLGHLPDFVCQVSKEVSLAIVHSCLRVAAMRSH